MTSTAINDWLRKRLERPAYRSSKYVEASCTESNIQELSFLVNYTLPNKCQLSKQEKHNATIQLECESCPNTAFKIMTAYKSFHMDLVDVSNSHRLSLHNH